MKNRQGRFVVVSTNHPIYDDIEKASREIEVLMLENPGDSYLITEVIAATGTRITIVPVDKPKRVSRQKKEKSFTLEDIGSDIDYCCEFDNNRAVKEVVMSDGTSKHLCEDHA